MSFAFGGDISNKSGGRPDPSTAKEKVESSTERRREKNREE